MNRTVLNPVKAVTLIGIGLAIGAMGFYVAEADDAPGAAAMGLVLMAAGVVLGVRAGRNRLPAWAARTALGVGVIAAAFAAALTHSVARAAPLFPQSQGVPSALASAPPPQYAAASARARELVRSAVLAENLPGVSVAVGAGGAIVWAEGFGWRDVGTEAPVTAKTRFVIGTASSAVTAAAAGIALADTGAESASVWSPEAIGEPGEDFPPLTLLRHHVLQPLGLAPAEYPLPGERATFYVPTVDDNPVRGRRLMPMRDLACCGDGKACYSTPSDLVRAGFVMDAAGIDGELAGGTVISLLTRRDRGLVVAVASNVAHADTSSLAQRIADAFADRTR